LPLPDGHGSVKARLRFPLLTLASVILFLGAIRLGDLAGYDDAMYSVEAKGIALTGDWLTPKVRGGPALEHPPLFVWTQAAFLAAFGISDPVAKLPVALCATGTILLVYWLALRLLENDTLAASVAMFVMLGTPYFIKYAGHAMTDVPTAFLFMCAICAWSLGADDPRWYVAAGAFTAMALMARGLIGFALPAIFAVDLIASRRRPSWRYLTPALLIAFLPFAAWDIYLFLRYRDYFVGLQGGWLSREVYGPLNPSWRRYTGVFEYTWMLAKSYWPWLPATLTGIMVIGRERRRSLYVLLGWAGTVLLLCAAARSRVLRYMLPAYPAFAILAAIGLLKWIPRRFVERAMDWIPPLAVAAAAAIVLLLTPSRHASDIRAIAEAQSLALPPGTPVGFYDKGEPRNDETNQLEWYGNDVPIEPYTTARFEEALQAGFIRVFVLDKATYETRVEFLPHDVIAQAGNLISVRLKPR
jgi:4-amino-4-deoxy-L-arabinose transferase-like glycosyltransferase